MSECQLSPFLNFALVQVLIVLERGCACSLLLLSSCWCMLCVSFSVVVAVFFFFCAILNCCLHCILYVFCRYLLQLSIQFVRINADADIKSNKQLCAHGNKCTIILKNNTRHKKKSATQGTKQPQREQERERLICRGTKIKTTPLNGGECICIDLLHCCFNTQIVNVSTISKTEKWKTCTYRVHTVSTDNNDHQDDDSNSVIRCYCVLVLLWWIMWQRAGSMHDNRRDLAAYFDFMRDAFSIRI